MKGVKTGTVITITFASICLLIVPAMAAINSVTLNAPVDGFQSRAGGGFNFSCNTSATDLTNLTLFTNISGSWQANASIRHGIFAVDVNEEVWDSRDYGAGWSSVNADMNGGGGNIICMAAAPNNIIYVVDTGEDVWASNDFGVTWNDTNTDYNGAEGQSAVAMAQYRGILWIAESDEDIWNSTDGGITWSKSTTNFDGSGRTSDAAGMVANSSGALIIVTNDAHVYASVTNGTTWYETQSDYSGASNNDPVAMTITDNDTLFILDTDSQVWKSNSGAGNWTQVSSDFNPGDGNSGVTLTSDGWNLFGADGSEDMYFSADFGLNWSLMASNINGAGANIIAMTSLRSIRGGPVNVQLNASVGNLTHGTYSWNCKAADKNGNTAFAASNRTFYSNISAALGNATASPNPVKGGDTITVTAVGPDDPDNQTLYFYCDEGGMTPDASNTDCTGGRTNSTKPYNLSCTYATTVGSALHQSNCRAFDGTYYSAVRTANFTTDSSPPIISNITWTPKTADQLDPNVMINITANVSDITGVNAVLLRSKQSNASAWSTTVMTDIGSGIYRGNFTPDTTGMWTFRVEANDTFNNSNSTDTSLSIELDGSWNIVPSSFGGVSGVISNNVSIGNLLINNTADYTHVFTISSNYANTFFNATTVTIPAGGTKVISVAATANSVVREDDVMLTVSTANTTAAQPNATSNFTLISYVSGPYLYLTVSAPAVVVQGESANVTATVKNLGDDIATDVWLAWDLPSGWSITSANANSSIGNLGVGNDDGDTFVLKAGGAAIGPNIITALGGCVETNSSKNATIVVIAPATTTTEIVTIGGGGGSMAAPSPDLFLDAPQSTEMTVGKEATIRVGVTSTYDDAGNLTLETSGFQAQYVTIQPRLIGAIGFNKTEYFSINVKAPTYMTEGKYPLTITVKGQRGENSIKKSVTVDLIIHTIAAAQLNASLDEAEAAISGMTAKGFDVARLLDMLGSAKTAMAASDFGSVQDLASEILRVKEQAFTVDTSIKELEKKIADAESVGRETAESRKALDLAKEAFSRGDYERAEARINAASLTFAIESSRINIISFLLKLWWAVLIAAALIVFLLASIWRELNLWRITSKLASLQKEEKAINQLMEKAQQEYFKQRTMPKVDFYRTMYEYEKRLGSVRASVAKLSSNKAKMMRTVEELKRLELEDKKIKTLIMELQKKYFEEGKISKDIYTRHLREYVNRRVQLAQSMESAKARLKTESHARGSGLKRLAANSYNRFMSAVERIFRKKGIKI